MTPQETVVIIGIINTAYPKFSIEANKDKMKMTVQLWHELLGDIPFPTIKTAVNKLILESPYPPTIADVRKRVVEVTQPRQLTTIEAWGEVMFAIQRFGWCRPEEALESMSQTTRKVVKAIGWQEICENENIDVLRGQFRNMYEALSSREQNDALLPQGLKEQIRLIGHIEQNLLEGETA